MEELTSQQQDELHRLLVTLQSELQELLTSTTDSSRPVDLEQPIGRLSRVDALQQQHMAIASRDAVEQRLVLIQNALKAIKGGHYGECRMCEEPVGYARLKARPESPFCLDCQEEQEGRR